VIGAIALRAGQQAIGPDRGTLRVYTYREGVVQKVRHEEVSCSKRTF
jgi:hypothetical protein